MSIDSITFSEKILDAEESAKLNITLKNIGHGDAKNVYVQLQGKDLPGLVFKKRIDFPLIPANGGKKTITVYIKADTNISTSRAHVDIMIIEPNFKVRVKGQRLTFSTRAFKNPELILAKFAGLENLSASPNNQIDLNEMVDIKLAIQNIGKGDADNVNISISNNQKGVMPIGYVYPNGLKKISPVFETIPSGKYNTVTFTCFVNSDFKDDELIFDITIGEKRKKYGFNIQKTIAVNTELKAEGYIRNIKKDDDSIEKEVRISHIPDFVVDIEKDLPVATAKNNNRYSVAVIIGNSNYKKLKKIDYAVNDSALVKRYLIDVLGYREGNILNYIDISKGNFETCFGNENEHNGRLNNLISAKTSKLFIYYSGHGAVGLKNKKSYFVPVEADPSYIELNGYSIETLMNNISRIAVKDKTIVIDACFSGADIYDNISPAMVNVKKINTKADNGIIISSSRSNQVSTWYNEKKHSMFTYFFLKAIHNKNGDVNSDGVLTYDELYSYISDRSEGVPYYARKLHNIDQVPMIIGDYASKIFVRY